MGPSNNMVDLCDKRFTMHLYKLYYFKKFLSIGRICSKYIANLKNYMPIWMQTKMFMYVCIQQRKGSGHQFEMTTVS